MFLSYIIWSEFEGSGLYHCLSLQLWAVRVIGSMILSFGFYTDSEQSLLLHRTKKMKHYHDEDILDSSENPLITFHNCRQIKRLFCFLNCKLKDRYTSKNSCIFFLVLFMLKQEYTFDKEKTRKHSQSMINPINSFGFFNDYLSN